LYDSNGMVYQIYPGIFTILYHFFSGDYTSRMCLASAINSSMICAVVIARIDIAAHLVGCCPERRLEAEIRTVSVRLRCSIRSACHVLTLPAIMSSLQLDNPCRTAILDTSRRAFNGSQGQ